MLIKLGEAISIAPEDIQSSEVVLADPEIVERFKKFAAGLKTIAPMAKDFLYFTAIMMHAAEAALLDAQGNLKKDAKNNPLSARWESVGDGVKWVCSDVNIRPYKNSNNDIFPEEELIKAHKKWIGRPLCLDHKSSSVDAIRGVIVDTYYDRKHKRVIALCALDKVNYPDLARKVATGYATSVSMGTAVGKAVCSECYRVARVESDFCDHMRNKSCYGEVNLELSPIELSIVVNGADPGAKIKHIIAKDLSRAADHLQDYVDNKLARGATSKEELIALQNDLSVLADRVSKLVETAEEKDDQNDAAYGVTRSRVSMADPAETSNSVMPPNGPEPWALWNSQVNELQTKLSTIEQSLNRLSTNFKTSEELTMSENQKRAYYQGGGGVNEPTPGKPKYEKEDYETIRNTQDKQMVGQSPFPDVGPVDGMHPGYDSYGESEAARKKRLQRMAEVEERRMQRQAALERAKDSINATKEAYWQGGGGPNEPTPGKRKYDVDPLEGEARKNDKQMVGQKPFPDVGPVDGMHPGYDSYKDTPWGNSEEQRKQNLGRLASLKAKFVKAATPDGRDDLGKSRWDIYADNKLILSATVDELTGGNTTGPLFNSVATKEFGLQVLGLIKAEGFEQAKAKLFKGAQAPAQDMGAPSVPMDAMPAMPPAPVGDMGEPMDKEPLGGGAPEANVMELLDKVKDAADETGKRADDLAEAVRAMEGETPELTDVLPSEEADLGAKAASVDSLQSMRKTLNSMLRSAMKETIGNLRAHTGELKLTASIYEKDLSKLSAEQKKYLYALASDGLTDANSTLAESLELMSAYIKYAHGTESLLKRAAAEASLSKLAKKDEEDEDEDEEDEEDEEEKENKKDKEDGEDKDDKNDADYEGSDVLTTMPSGEAQVVEPGEMGERSVGLADDNDQPVPTLNPPKKQLDPEFQKALENLKKEMGKPPEKFAPPPGAGMSKEEQERMFSGGGLMDMLNAADADDAGVSVTLPGGAKAHLEPGADVTTLPSGTQVAKAEAEFDLSTKEGRAAYRMKLAQKGVQYSDMVGRAHPKGGHQPGGLDTKPSDNLGLVETVEETKEKMMQLANLPPKVRKQAAKIQELVEAGRITAEEVPGLVANGVDADAVKYWQQYYGQASDSESKEFAKKLVAEHAQQKMAAELETHKVKIKRAYDLAQEMCARGMIEPGQVKSQVEEILTWNDNAFESTKRLIAKQALKKQAMPQVGLLHSSDVILPAAERNVEQENLQQVFSDYFANRKF